MIFRFFKRSPPPPPPRPAVKRRAKPRQAELPTQPSELPQVTEASDPQAWELWENSVATLDSQLQSINRRAKRFVPDAEAPTDFQPVEAYATVKKKDP